MTEISDKELKMKVCWDVMLCHWTSTGLFISPSGISELDCATTKTHGRKEHINR